MKKMLLFVSILVAFSCGSAFAHGYDSGQVSYQGEHGQGSGGKSEQMRGLHIAIKGKMAAIRQNQREINRLRLNLDDEIRQSKILIGDLRKDPASLNASRIIALKQTMERITQAQQVLSTTAGAMQRKNGDLKFAKSSKKAETFSQVMDGIISIQETRINALSELVSSLNVLNDQLE